MPMPSVSEVRKALSSSVRRQLIELYAKNQPLNPKAASDLLRIRLSTVSYHVRVLADCQFLTVERKEPVRGTERTFYRLNEEVLALKSVQELLPEHP